MNVFRQAYYSSLRKFCQQNVKKYEFFFTKNLHFFSVKAANSKLLHKYSSEFLNIQQRKPAKLY